MSVKASPGLSPEKENQNQNPQGFKNLEGLVLLAFTVASEVIPPSFSRVIADQEQSSHSLINFPSQFSFLFLMMCLPSPCFLYFCVSNFRKHHCNEYSIFLVKRVH